MRRGGSFPLARMLQTAYCLLTVWLAGIAQAQDVLEFEPDFDVTHSTTPSRAEENKPWRLHASYLQSWSVPGDKATRVQHAGIQFQYEDLIAKQLYSVIDATLLLRGPDDPRTEANKNYKLETRIHSIYAQASVDNYSLKAGYQTAAWGKMDLLGVTDRLSPWDFSQFVFTSPQDARVAQGMVTATHFIRPGVRGEFIYNMAPKVNLYPGGGAEYLLRQQLGTDNFTLLEQKPEAFSDYEIALRLKVSQDAFDGTLTLARLLQNEPVYEVIGPSQFQASYPPYYLLAYSYNIAGDGVLWKLALAYSHDKSYTTANQRIKANAMQWGAGFDVNAGNDLSYTVEAAFTYHHLPAGVGLEKNTTQVAARVAQSFFHKTLEAVYYVQYYVEDHAQTHSLSLRYSAMDDLSVELVETIFKVNDDNAPSKFTDQWDSLSLSMIYSW